MAGPKVAILQAWTLSSVPSVSQRGSEISVASGDPRLAGALPVSPNSHTAPPSGSSSPPTRNPERKGILPIPSHDRGPPSLLTHSIQLLRRKQTASLASRTELRKRRQGLGSCSPERADPSPLAPAPRGDAAIRVAKLGDQHLPALASAPVPGLPIPGPLREAGG